VAGNAKGSTGSKILNFKYMAWEKTILKIQYKEFKLDKDNRGVNKNI